MDKTPTTTHACRACGRTSNTFIGFGLDFEPYIVTPAKVSFPRMVACLSCGTAAVPERIIRFLTLTQKG